MPIWDPLQEEATTLPGPGVQHGAAAEGAGTEEPRGCQPEPPCGSQFYYSCAASVRPLDLSEPPFLHLPGGRDDAAHRDAPCVQQRPVAPGHCPTAPSRDGTGLQ